MKFNEKLINLRKKQGLSQEELGYKLNVTRQTISKWELGQTTPEMDKLLEISKYFGVSVDELTNEEDISKIDPVIRDGNGHNKAIVVLVIFLIMIFAVFGIISTNIFKMVKNEADEIMNQKDEIMNKSEVFLIDVKDMQDNFDDANSIIEDAKNAQNQMIEDSKNAQNQLLDEAKEKQEQLEEKSMKSNLTSTLELYDGDGGESNGLFVRTALDRIIDNNRKNKNYIVTVVYEGKTYSELDELRDLISKIERGNDYTVLYDYDEDNYIYQMNIK